MTNISPINGPVSPNSLSDAMLESPLFISVFRMNKANAAQAVQGVTSSSTPVATVAATPLTPLPPDTAVILGSKRFNFSSIEVVRLINQINPDGVSFVQLRDFSPKRLTAEQQKIQQFLVQNPQTFKRFAALDRNAKTLSAGDIQLAASLAGNPNKLDNADLEKIRDLFLNQTDSLDIGRRKAVPEANVSDIRNTASPSFSGGNPSTQATPSLPTRAAGQYTPPLDTRFSGPAKNDKIASAQNTDLSRNELVKAQQAMQFAGTINEGVNEPFENDTTFEDRMRVNPIRSNDELRPLIRTRQKIEIHTKDLKDLFDKINLGKPVTLGQLRLYRPRNQREERVLSVLKRMRVFEELSQMDGHDDTLAIDDIQIATDGKSFIFSDPHMYLVISPD